MRHHIVLGLPNSFQITSGTFCYNQSSEEHIPGPKPEDVERAREKKRIKVTSGSAISLAQSFYALVFIKSCL